MAIPTPILGLVPWRMHVGHGADRHAGVNLRESHVSRRERLMAGSGELGAQADTRQDAAVPLADHGTVDAVVRGNRLARAHVILCGSAEAPSSIECSGFPRAQRSVGWSRQAAVGPADGFSSRAGCAVARLLIINPFALPASHSFALAGAGAPSSSDTTTTTTQISSSFPPCQTSCG